MRYDKTDCFRFVAFPFDSAIEALILFIHSRIQAPGKPRGQDFLFDLWLLSHCMCSTLA